MNREGIKPLQLFKILNDAISFFLELSMLAAFAYAGFHFGNRFAIQLLAGIGIPALVIVFWAKYMAPKAKKRLSFPWLHLVTFGLFEASAVALYCSGAQRWAVVFGIICLVNVGVKVVDEWRTA